MHQFIMGGVGAGVGRVGQLNLCVETIHYFEGLNVTVLEIISLYYCSSDTKSIPKQQPALLQATDAVKRQLLLVDFPLHYNLVPTTFRRTDWLSSNSDPEPH